MVDVYDMFYGDVSVALGFRLVCVLLGRMLALADVLMKVSLTSVNRTRH